MERSFVAAAGLGAILTANGLRPSKVNIPVAGSFVSAVITIELAPWQIAAQGLATSVALRRGATAGIVGKAALGINVASWSALAFLTKTGVDASRDFATALTDVGVRDDGSSAGARVAPLPIRREPGVEVTRDVEYATVDQVSLKLDVFQPAGSAASEGTLRPAILQIHGGSWVSGDKRQQGAPLLNHLANNGWVGFNANYRLGPIADASMQLSDIKRALAFIRRRAAHYGVDPHRIAVTGGSAGGHLAALVALTANEPQYQRDFETVDTSVAAAICFYGVYDLTNEGGVFDSSFLPFIEKKVMQCRLEDEPERFRALSPIHLLGTLHGSGADVPPFLVIHGEADTVVPVEEARRFVGALRAASKNEVAYAELPYAQHAFDVIRSARTNAAVEAVSAFLTHTSATDTAPRDRGIGL